MAAVEEPPAKKAKTDEESSEAPKVEEDVRKVPELPKELEEHAPVSKKPSISEAVTFHVKDTTLNILPSMTGDVLKPMTDGGLDNLLAGARANVGIRSGRYMYEVKIIESLGWGPQAKSVQIGFSTSSTDLFVGEGTESVCFDSEGMFLAEDKKSKVGPKWGHREDVLAVLLNLDKTSPNFNTVSLFKGGVRLSQPQALPEAMKNKALFPALTFKGVTVHVNFAMDQLAPLPFTCRMVGKADKGDVEVIAAPSLPKDGKYELLFPVGLPEEGPYDWLDMFLQKTPKYTELSQRAILHWCQKSGLWRKTGYDMSTLVSVDKPEFNVGVPAMSDGSMMKVLYAIATMQPRDFVIMDLRSNLVKESREKMLLEFPSYMFKRIAVVAVGEPTAEFKKFSQSVMLREKQAAADKAHKQAFADEKSKWVLAKRQKQFEREKKKLEKQKLKALEEAKKKVEEQKAAALKTSEEKKEGEEEKKEGEDKKKEGEEEKKEGEEEKKAEEPDAEDEEQEPVEPDDPEPMETDPPKVELTAEEKGVKFRTTIVPDFTPFIMSTTFSKISVPSKEDGFDEVRFEWSKGPSCEEYVKKWIIHKKQTTRMEDLQPSTWFQNKNAQWLRVLKEWNSKQHAWRGKVQIKEAAKKQKEIEKAKKAAAAAAAAKAAALQKEIEAKKAAEAATEEGAEKKEEVEDEKKQEPEPEKEEEEMEVEEELPEFDDLDIFGVQDVTDLGKEMPLFKEFQTEDWSLTSLRFELSTLVHAFRKDANDPERTGITLEHLPFYYQKYYRKAFVPKQWGVETAAEVIALVSDSVYVKDEVLETLVAEEYEQLGIFAKLTEEARRLRMILIDSGDESARLKFTAAPDQGKGGKRDAGKGDSKGKWDNGGWSKGGWDKGDGKGKWDNAGWDNGKGGGWDKGGGKGKWDDGKGGGKQWGKQKGGGGGNQAHPYSGKGQKW